MLGRFVMQITQIYNNISPERDFSLRNPQFEHSHNLVKGNEYKPSEKALVAGTTTLGVLASLALLAKSAKYSLKPSKMFKDIKNSYLAQVDFEAKEVIAMGAGSCLGGLAGGFMIDKDKDNRKAKLRESIMQIGNVSIPILTVHLLVTKVFKNASKGVQAFAGLGGVFIGVAIANFVMNRFNNLLFNEKQGEGRKMKISDFAEHPDDVIVAANYIAKGNFVHAFGRIIPFALLIPGLETGNKKAASRM